MTWGLLVEKRGIAVNNDDSEEYLSQRENAQQREHNLRKGNASWKF